MPELPTGANIEDMEIRALVELYRIKAAEQYAEKDYLLERDGVGFSPRGNVCAIAAEKKAGKTWLCMAMSAAMTAGQFLGMKARAENARVAFFDTEQDAGDGQRIQKRVHYVNGWDFNTDHDEFQIFHLRELASKERREFVLKATKFLKPDLVIVDGIRDLISDFNDLDQSANLIQEFMSLSSELQCCIWAVLHVNPNSEKMRGHLGTELGNKVADILYMTKNKNPKNEDDVTYKMEETDARGHKDIHSITFRIEDSLPYGQPVIVGEEELQQMEADELQALRDDMRKAMPDSRVFSKTAIRDSLKKGKGIGSTKADRIITDALRQKVIEEVQTPHGLKYRYNDAPIPKTVEMPFGQPGENDECPFA